MPDVVRKPFRWSAEVKAWADGHTIQMRTCNLYGTWTPWRMCLDAPMRDDINIQYRVPPTIEPFKWQREREAFLAGKKVEFRNSERCPGSSWFTLDDWTEKACREGRNGEGGPIWDREFLQFRISDTFSVQYLCVDGSSFRFGEKGSNLKLSFVNGQLKEATILGVGGQVHAIATAPH